MDKREFESLRRTVTTPFGEIAYVEKGEGPAALFVHGVFLNGYLWRNVIDGLASERRCIALDLMGHGATRVSDEQDLSFAAQADMLAAFVDALGIDTVDLVGNDSGGGIAQIFAAKHPQRVRTLTLTNCDVSDNVFPEAFVPVVEVCKAGAMLKVFEPLVGNAEPARKAFGNTFESPEKIDQETFDAYLAPAVELEKSSRATQRWMQALLAEDLSAVTPLLRELQAPALIVWGTDDVFFDTKWAYWLQETLGGPAEVVEVSGARLFFPEERPEELVGYVRGFWARSAPVQVATSADVA